jgi:uncharacterized LabA/DUF88 family protein
MKQEIVIGYVDGFNLYYGLRDMNWKHYYWMNIEDLCVNLLKSNQYLAATYYFTSRVKNNPDKQKRQTTYLEALDKVGVEIIYGRYRDVEYECPSCGKIQKEPKEKMTDVAIAVQLLVDAYSNKYDKAVIISGDIDLIPAIKVVKRPPLNKKVIMVFPPMRYCSDFGDLVDGCLHIDERKCRASQLPDIVTRADGFQLTRPSEWT